MAGQPALEAFATWKRLLSNRNVAWLWTGQAISQVGDGLSVFNTGTLVASMAGMTAGGWITDHMGPAVSLSAMAAVNAAAAVFTVILIPWCHRLRSDEDGRKSGDRKNLKAAA